MEQVKKVLAVEIEPEHASHLARCLAAMGLAFRVAASAAEAMRLLRREVFDGAVVAAELGLEEGAILARLSCLPATRFLLATGPADDVDLERRARAAGADAYLPRPVDATTLGRGLAQAGARAPPGARCRPGPKGGDAEAGVHTDPSVGCTGCVGRSARRKRNEMRRPRNSAAGRQRDGEQR